MVVEACHLRMTAAVAAATVVTAGAVVLTLDDAGVLHQTRNCSAPAAKHMAMAALCWVSVTAAPPSDGSLVVVPGRSRPSVLHFAVAFQRDMEVEIGRQDSDLE